jgi:hypothetical protein
VDFKRLRFAFTACFVLLTACPDDTSPSAGTDTDVGGTTSDTDTNNLTTGMQLTTAMPTTDGDGDTMVDPTPPGDTTMGGGDEDCCSAHASPGCDDPTCSDAVCEMDAVCCAFEWAPSCANLANDVCRVCGATGEDSTTEDPGTDTGNNNDQCCEPSMSPGCANENLEGCVCGLDPFCCEEEWDQQCINLGINSCGSSCMVAAGDCCAAGNAPGCDDAECESQVCDVDAFCCSDQWDMFCSNQATGICAICGAGRGDCCEANATAGCSDDACVSLMCGFQGAAPECCGAGPWDQACADTAAAICTVCGAAGTDTSCTPGGPLPNCGTPFSQAYMCQCDSFCAGRGDCCEDVCPQCDGIDGVMCPDPPGEGDCCAANGSPGCEVGACQNAVCQADPTCCDMEWTQACADQASMVCTACGAFVCQLGTGNGGAACPDADAVACICEGCDAGGGCQLTEDCTCPDCANDGFCSSPQGCNSDGACDPYLEGCNCADCANHPGCP